MADFVRFGEAVGRRLGWPEGTFLEAYLNNRRKAALSEFDEWHVGEPDPSQTRAYRTQDQVDIENLVAANSDNLDLDWIRAEWQNLAGLDDPRVRRLLELVSESRPAS
jgi:hypothetical protein